MMASLLRVTITALLINRIECFHTRREASGDAVTCKPNYMFLVISRHYTQSAVYIYVQDEHGQYHNVRDMAGQCLYDVSETPGFFTLWVSYSSCHVKRAAGVYTLPVVVKELLNEGRLEISKAILMMCSVTPDTSVPDKEAGHGGFTLSQKYCSNSGFNIVIAQNATKPLMDLNSVYVEGNRSVNCLPKHHSAQSVAFQFSFTSCGVKKQVHGGNITFWVNIMAQMVPHFKQGSLFREAPLFRLTISCTFVLFNTSSSKSVAVKTQKSVTTSVLKKEGVLRAQIRFATDSSFRNFYKSEGPPVRRVLGDPVFVEIFVLKREDRDLELLLDDCWATPSADPEDKHRWNLLHKGCPQQAADFSVEVLDVQAGSEVKYPKLHKRLKIKMFSFVETEDIYESVYLHCDAEVCKGVQCQRTCNRKRRQSSVEPDLKKKRVLQHVLGGPLLFTI